MLFQHGPEEYNLSWYGQGSHPRENKQTIRPVGWLGITWWRSKENIQANGRAYFLSWKPKKIEIFRISDFH